MLSYVQLRDHILAENHEASDDTLLLPRIKVWTNLILFKISSATNWRWLERVQEMSLGGQGAASEASVAYLPEYVERVIDVYSATSGFRDPLQIIGAWEFDFTYPAAAVGREHYFVQHGYYGVERDNPSTGTLSLVSSSALDIGVTVIVEGQDSSNREIVQTVTLNGIVPVVTTSSFRAGPGGVSRVAVDGNSVPSPAGTLTVTRAGTILERLNMARELFHEHIRAEIYPQPSTTTFQVRFYQKLKPVVNTTETLPVPYQFDDLIILGVGAYLAEFRGKSDMATFRWAMYNKRLEELKGWSNREPGKLTGFRPLAQFGGRNRFGGYIT